MKLFMNRQTWAVGLAMFSMFFGAGNIIFPLALGQWAGDKDLFAILGLILTGVVVPFGGVFAMILFEGDQKRFFGRMGRVPGFLVAFLVISLLGPLGSTPRCIALTYTTVQSFLPALSPTVFGMISCAVIYLFAVSKKRLLNLLGVVLTPLLLISLIAIVILGLIHPQEIRSVEHTPFQAFFTGLKEGYNTMDLLAAFFFSATILSLLKGSPNRSQISIRAGVIAMALLTLIYAGFSLVAAMHGRDLMQCGKDELLSALSYKFVGPHAGVLVCIAIGLACLTTATALISVFADFMQREVFKEKVSYKITLAGSLVITFIVSTFQFTGISTFLGPVLQMMYPALILLTMINIVRGKSSWLANQVL